jgi:hypothetical protein
LHLRVRERTNALANTEREVGINIDELSCDGEIEFAVHESSASGVRE